MDSEERRSKERLCIGLMVVFTLLLILASLGLEETNSHIYAFHLIFYVSGFLYYSLLTHRLLSISSFRFVGILVSYVFSASAATIIFLFQNVRGLFMGSPWVYMAYYILIYFVLMFSLTPGSIEEPSFVRGKYS